MWKYARIVGRRDRLRLIPVFGLNLTTSFLEVFGLGLLLPFFQVVASPESVLEGDGRLAQIVQALPVDISGNPVAWIGGFLLLVFLVKGLLSVFSVWLTSRTVYNMYRSAGRRTLRNYLLAPIVVVTARNSAEVIRNVADDTQKFFSVFMMAALGLASESIALAAILVAMLFVDPLVTAIAVFGFGVVTYVLFSLMRRRSIEWGRIKQRRLSDMFRWVAQGIGGIKEVQVLGAATYILNSYDEATEDYALAARGQALYQRAPRVVLEVLIVVVLVSLVLVISSGEDSLDVWLSKLVFFGAASIRMAPAATRILTHVTLMRSTVANADVVYRGLFEMPRASKQSAASAREAIPFEREIRFEDATYTYPNTERPAVDHLNLTIERGTTVAFVGSTGAGKTSAVDLLLALLQLEEGDIKVDGVSIRGKERSWQRRLGYVPQFIYLADLTIRENVAFGVPEEAIDDAAVWRALEQAAVAEHIRSLPGGIHAAIGERGVRLSGGQRQRLGIARALYHDPDLLVMDEATSALDSETERRISEAIATLHGTKTIVLIAHRLTTVRDADKIVLMAKGQLEEEGTFDELVERSATFRRLARGLSGVDEVELPMDGGRDNE